MKDFNIVLKPAQDSISYIWGYNPPCTRFLSKLILSAQIGVVLRSRKREQFKKFLPLTLFSNLRQNLRLKTDLSLKGRGVKKAAFTLAEVLIALLIIGVVAAMTLPNFINNITERSNATKVAVFNSKFIAGLNSAKAQGDMGNQFKDTYDFLQNGLSHHLKMLKICDNDNLKECFGYDEITYELNSGKDKAISISELKDAKNIKILSPYFSNTAAFIMGDGTPVLLTYNTKCTTDGGADKVINPCVAGLFDINGSRKPNMFLNKFKDGKSEMGDIRSFNGASVYKCIGEIEDICLASSQAIGGYAGRNAAYNQMYEDVKSALGGNYLRPTYSCGNSTCNNNWQLASDYCKNILKAELPSKSQLNQLASLYYSSDKNRENIRSILNITGKESPVHIWGASEGSIIRLWDNNHYDWDTSGQLGADVVLVYCTHN